MKKSELLQRIKSGGVKNMLAARRIGRSRELSQLDDDADITVETIEAWINATGCKRFDALSDSDILLIGRIVEPKKATETGKSVQERDPLLEIQALEIQARQLREREEQERAMEVQARQLQMVNRESRKMPPLVAHVRNVPSA